jgi:hypothetical protein
MLGFGSEMLRDSGNLPASARPDRVDEGNPIMVIHLKHGNQHKLDREPLFINQTIPIREEIQPQLCINPCLILCQSEESQRMTNEDPGLLKTPSPSICHVRDKRTAVYKRCMTCQGNKASPANDRLFRPFPGFQRGISEPTSAPQANVLVLKHTEQDTRNEKGKLNVMQCASRMLPPLGPAFPL